MLPSISTISNISFFLFRFFSLTSKPAEILFILFLFFLFPPFFCFELALELVEMTGQGGTKEEGNVQKAQNGVDSRKLDINTVGVLMDWF